MEEQINNYPKQIEDFQLQKIPEQSIDYKQLVSISQHDGYQQYRLSFHRQDHSELDTLFQQLYPGINQTNDWQITFLKPIDQVKVRHM